MVLTKIADNSAKQGLYTIQDSKGLYIKCSDAKNISGVSTLDDACYWKITFDKINTLWKIASTTTTPTCYLLYNTANPRFTTYEKTSQSVIDIKLISYKDVLPLTKPILSADKAITVPAVGIENGSMSITVKNIKTVNTSVDGTVVTSASVSGDILTYTVSKNTTTDIRNGFITLSAEGVDDVTIEVTQNGVGSAEPTTVTKKISEISGTSANGTQKSSMKMDDVITLTASDGTNNGKVYEKGTEWRLYQSEEGTMTVSSKAGYVIESIIVTFTNKKSGTLLYNGNVVTSGKAVSVSGSSVEFTLGNSSTATNGQIIVTEISVTYKQQ